MDEGTSDESDPKADGDGFEPRQPTPPPIPPAPPPPPPPPPPPSPPAALFELHHLTHTHLAAYHPPSPNWPPFFPLKIEVHQSFVDQYVRLPNVHLSMALEGHDRTIGYGVKTGGQIVPIEQHPTLGSQPWQMQRKNFAGGAHGYWLEFNVHHPYDGMRLRVVLHPNVDHQLRRTCDHLLIWQGGQIRTQRL